MSHKSEVKPGVSDWGEVGVRSEALFKPQRLLWCVK